LLHFNVDGHSTTLRNVRGCVCHHRLRLGGPLPVHLEAILHGLSL
jgi:hypothetical protein